MNTSVNAIPHYFHPVVHVDSIAHAVEQACKAQDAGAHGVWMIQHDGISLRALEAAGAMKSIAPDFYVGVNLLGEPLLQAAEKAMDAQVDGIWFDYVGISSKGPTEHGLALFELLQTAPMDVFAGAAFKYQEEEPDPAGAARQISSLGWIPCTSGSATGQAANPGKTQLMRAASQTGLGLASGVDADNIALYLPYVTHFLVASSISENFTTLDFEKMYRLRRLMDKCLAENV